MEFKNGKAIIKQGRKIFAKVYNRPEFFKNEVYFNPKFPYALHIIGLGQRECETLEEVNFYLQKYSDSIYSL